MRILTSTVIAAGAGAENMEFHTNNSVILTRDGSLDSRYRRSRLYIAAVALQPVVVQPEGSREIQGKVVDTGFHTGSFVLITVSTVTLTSSSCLRSRSESWCIPPLHPPRLSDAETFL